MTSLTKKNVTLQVLHQSCDAASRIHGAMSSYTKHICYLIDTNKNSSHTGTVFQIHNAWIVKTGVSDGPGIGRHRLRIVVTIGIRSNVVLQQVDSSPRDKKAQKSLLAALGSTPLSCGENLTTALFSDGHAHKPTCARKLLKHKSGYTRPPTISFSSNCANLVL